MRPAKGAPPLVSLVDGSDVANIRPCEDAVERIIPVGFAVHIDPGEPHLPVLVKEFPVVHNVPGLLGEFVPLHLDGFAGLLLEVQDLGLG